MERYDCYKDSGVEWIGEIPENWHVFRLKKCLEERKKKNSPVKTTFILSLTNKRGVIPYTEKGDIGNKAKEDPSGYYLAYPGDLVINSMNAVIGSVGLSQYYGAVSPVYYILYPRRPQDDVRYFSYIFQMAEFQNALRGLGNGILEIRMRIPMSKLNNVLMPIPSSKEQSCIADYLDTKAAQIDSLIEKNEKTIELLEEYRRSVISEVVTKGLDPNVPMKDSGVEWIGKIPKGWSLPLVKFCMKISNGSDPKTEGNTPVYGSGGSSFGTCGETKEGPCVLLGRKGTLNKPSYVENSYWNVDTAFDAKPSDEKTNLKFFYYCACCFDIDRYSSSTALPSMTQTAYGSMCIPLPSRKEQEIIVSYIDKKTSQIDSLIDKKKQLIEKLQEYRKSLISECVTGKIKVPGVE